MSRSLHELELDAIAVALRARWSQGETLEPMHFEKPELRAAVEIAGGAVCAARAAFDAQLPPAFVAKTSEAQRDALFTACAAVLGGIPLPHGTPGA